MANSYPETEGTLKVIKCILPEGQQILLLANNKQILFFKLDSNSPWESMKPAYKELLATILHRGVKITQRLL